MSDNNNNKGLTDEQLEKLIQSETDKVRTKYSKDIKELEDKLAEFETKTKKYEAREKYYQTVEVLEKHNIPTSIAKYIDLNIEDEKAVEEFTKTFKENYTDTGYKPTNKKTDDGYEKAIKEGDVENALKHKIGRLFT